MADVTNPGVVNVADQAFDGLPTEVQAGGDQPGGLINTVPGPRGPAGPAGPTGPAGPPGNIAIDAVISFDSVTGNFQRVHIQLLDTNGDNVTKATPFMVWLSETQLGPKDQSGIVVFPGLDLALGTKIYTPPIEPGAASLDLSIAWALTDANGQASVDVYLINNLDYINIGCGNFAKASNTQLTPNPP